jgi:AcrR family transcriptional regulator
MACSQRGEDCDPLVQADHRKGPRRRGEVLFQAIYDATLAELVASGYAGMAMERVAARARTSKASLYRRWPSRAELVADAIRNCVAETESLPDTGSLRDDLLTAMRRMAERLSGPFGEALRGMLAETLADPSRTQAARARMTSVGGHVMQDIVDRARGRGEISRPQVPTCALKAAPVLLLHHFLTHGGPVPDDVICQIVDEVALPLLCVTSQRPAVSG